MLTVRAPVQPASRRTTSPSARRAERAGLGLLAAVRGPPVLGVLHPATCAYHLTLARHRRTAAGPSTAVSPAQLMLLDTKAPSTNSAIEPLPKTHDVPRVREYSGVVPTMLHFDLSLVPTETAAISDWLAAAAALVSAGTALIGLLFTRRQLLAQLADVRSRLQETRSAQAGAITAWAERREDNPDGKHTRTVVAHNGSESPVYQVRVWLYSEQRGDARNAMGPPARDPTARRAVPVPGDPLRYPVPVDSSAPSDRPPVAMTFHDANGRGWFRRFTGGVVELAPEASSGSF